MGRRQAEERLILAIRDEFRAIHEDSHYITPVREGPIDLSLVFDVRRSVRGYIDIDVSIFNTGSPKQRLELMDKINERFVDRVIMADEFMVKFDRFEPVTTQYKVSNKPKIEQIELLMNAKYYKNDTNGPDNIQLSRI